jgi:hypothetical protein
LAAGGGLIVLGRREIDCRQAAAAPRRVQRRRLWAGGARRPRGLAGPLCRTGCVDRGWPGTRRGHDVPRPIRPRGQSGAEAGLGLKSG